MLLKATATEVAERKPVEILTNVKPKIKIPQEIEIKAEIEIKNEPEIKTEVNRDTEGKKDPEKKEPEGKKDEKRKSRSTKSLEGGDSLVQKEKRKSEHSTRETKSIDKKHSSGNVKKGTIGSEPQAPSSEALMSLPRSKRLTLTQAPVEQKPPTKSKSSSSSEEKPQVEHHVDQEAPVEHDPPMDSPDPDFDDIDELAMLRLAAPDSDDEDEGSYTSSEESSHEEPAPVPEEPVFRPKPTPVVVHHPHAPKGPIAPLVVKVQQKPPQEAQPPPPLEPYPYADNPSSEPAPVLEEPVFRPKPTPVVVNHPHAAKGPVAPLVVKIQRPNPKEQPQQPQANSSSSEEEPEPEPAPIQFDFGSLSLGLLLVDDAPADPVAAEPQYESSSTTISEVDFSSSESVEVPDEYFDKLSLDF